VNADLEMLVSADEQARAGVESARRSAEAGFSRAREEADRRKQDRARACEAALDREVQSIAEETARRVEERRQRRRRYVAGLSQTAAKLLPAAVEAWVRIVQDGPARRGGEP
jgi:hypothetical protein